MKNGTNLTKKATLEIGKGVLLKILEEDSICESDESGGMSIDFKVKKRYLKGFYIGKKYFDVNKESEIISPEFAEEQSSGKKIFNLFAYKDKNHNMNMAYKLSNLEINPKRRLDVKYFPIDYFHSSLEIKYLNEYLNKKIKNWKNKQNLLRKIGEK